MHYDAIIPEGSTLDGRFRIERLLGRGGYGEVYAATQLSMHRKVAIKVLRSRLAHQLSAVERFQKEARYACQLTHPNTVVYYDFGWDEPQGLLYLVMEFLDGDTLDHHLKSRGPMSLRETHDVLEQVCGALGEAHAVGLVHRDIKPSNIMLIERAGKARFVKVIDFGIVKTVEHPQGLPPEASPLTETGALLGSPHYMAPEQIRLSDDPIDQRADIYALGCLTYKLLTGVPPFRGRSPLDIATRHLTEPAPALSAVVTNARFPRALEALIAATLSKTPDARPPTAHAFLEAFAKAIEGAEDKVARAEGHPTIIRQEVITSPMAHDVVVDLSSASAPSPSASPSAPRPAPHSTEEVRAQLHAETIELSPEARRARSAPNRRTLLLIGLVFALSLAVLGGVLALVSRDKHPPDAATQAASASASPSANPETPAQAESPIDPTPPIDATGATDPTNPIHPTEPTPSMPPTARADLAAAPAPNDDGPAPPASDPPKASGAPKPAKPSGQGLAVTIPLPDASAAAAPTPKASPASASTGPSDSAPKSAAPGAPISVTVSVQPWGTLTVGGKTGETRVQVALKPGRHPVTIKQRGKVTQRSILVQPGKTSYTVRAPL